MRSEEVISVSCYVLPRYGNIAIFLLAFCDIILLLLMDAFY